MNVIHEQVQHQQYGFGNVTEQTERIITVQFCEGYGIKKFLYPSAFEKYLVLCNPALQEQIKQINEELRQIREQIESERKQREKEAEKRQAQIEAKRKQREEEAEKRQAEERLKQLELKRAAAKKRTPIKSGTKKTPAKSLDRPEPMDGIGEGGIE